MKSIHIVGGLLVVSAGLLAPMSSQAQQFTTISQVLSECPDLDGATACVPAAAGFVGVPTPPSDPEISALALSLAQAAQFPRVPMPVCLNTADGIRILAQAASSGATAQQLLDIADSLCLGVGTAAIGPTEPAVSLVAVDPDDAAAATDDSNGGSSNGGSTNGGSTNGGSTNGGNGGHGNGGHGNGGHGNGGHGNGGHGNGGHGNGGHDNGGNGGHGNGGHGNGGHDNGGNGGHGNGGHGNGGHDNGGNGGHGNGGHGNGGHDNGGNGGHGNGGHGNGGHDKD